MLKSLFLSGLLLFILSFPGKGQDNGKKFEFSPNTANPNARVLMKEDFFWIGISYMQKKEYRKDYLHHFRHLYRNKR